jgi:small-conductance mechanosensitive channel
MKIEKISSRVLLCCVILIIVCFGVFLTIGYDNPVGDHNEPVLTDLIMWLMYLLVAGTAVLTCWSVVRSAQSSKGNDPAATTGVPGGKIIMFTGCLTIVSLVLGLVLGLGESDFTASDGTVTTGGWVTLVDVFCVSMGVLFVAAAIAVIVSMTGVMTKSASK